MKKLLPFVLLFGAVGFATPALAVDRDNNGIDGDETHVPGTYDGDALGGGVVPFPTSGDTWAVMFYPYWWNVGDTAFGVHDPGISSVNHADVTLKISFNVLNGGGHVDLDFRIDGVTVGSFVVTEADGLGTVVGSFDFAAMTPPFELRYYATNTVASGAGSISIDETGLSMVEFSGDATPINETTWAAVKRLYR
jgi:hypothetical protein